MPLVLFITLFLTGWRVLQCVSLSAVSTSERWVASYIIGTVCGGVGSLAWVFLFGYESLWFFLVGSAIWAGVPAVRGGLTWQKPTDSFHFLLFLSLCIVLWPLFSSHTFWSGSTGVFSAGSTWGDSALHATLTNWFAFQPQLDLTNPIFATEKTSYPFLIDFLSGLYRRYGLSLRDSLLITSFPLAVSALFLFGALVARVANKVGGVLAVGLLLTTGSSAGIFWAVKDWAESGLPLRLFLTQLQDYSNLPSRGLYWSNLVADMLLPQRGFVIGFATAMVCAFIVLTSKQERLKKSLYLVSVTVGLLPLFHIHSFGLLLGLLIWMGGIAVWKRELKLLVWLQCLGIVVLVAAVPLWWQLTQVPTESFVSLQWGWYKTHDEWFIPFWLKSWGGYFLLLVTFPLVARWIQILKKLVPLWSGLFVLFFLCNSIQFQPNLYDNTKFLVAVQIFLSGTMAVVLTKLWQIKQQIVAAGLATALVATGSLTLLREYQLSDQIASNAELALAAQVVRSTSTHDRFLIAPAHNHPVTMLAGRQVLLGYPGWLWTHGINSAQADADLREIYRGGSRAEELLRLYQIRYVVISARERAHTMVNQDFFAERFTVFLKTNDTVIYVVE